MTFIAIKKRKGIKGGSDEEWHCWVLNEKEQKFVNYLGISAKKKEIRKKMWGKEEENSFTDQCGIKTTDV